MTADRQCQRCHVHENLAFGRCEACRRYLAMLLGKILGLDGPAWDESGVFIDWDDIDRLFAEMVSDPNMAVKTLTRTLTAFDMVQLGE